MEFIAGTTAFLSSTLVLAVLARISATNPQASLFQGEVAPALISVLVTSGLAVGFVMMVIGGESYFASRSTEIAVILGLTLASIWITTRFVVRGNRG